MIELTTGIAIVLSAFIASLVIFLSLSILMAEFLHRFGKGDNHGK